MMPYEAKTVPSTLLLLALFVFQWGHGQIHLKDSLKRVVMNLPANHEKVDALTALAHVYRFRKADSLRINAESALHLATQLGYDKGRAMALLRMGDYYSDMGENKNALDIYERAKDQATAINAPELLIEVFKSIAIHHSFNQEEKDAIIAYYGGIDIASTHGLKEAEARMRHNIGYIYGNYNLYKEAFLEYQKADSLWSFLDNRMLKGATLSNMALNAIYNGDLELARPYMDESLSYLDAKEHPLWYSRATRCKSRYFLQKNEPDSAWIWIGRSINTLKELDNPRDALENEMIVGDIHIQKKDYGQAWPALQKALRLAIDFNDLPKQAVIFKNLSLLEEEKGNTASALSALKKSDSLHAVTDIVLKKQNIGILRSTLEFQNEKENLKKKAEFTAQQQKKYIQWSTAALVVLIALIVLVVQSNTRKKQLNNALLENSRIMAEKQKILEENNTTKDVLFSVIGHDLRGPITSLNGLLAVCLEDTEEGKSIFQKFAPALKNKVGNILFTLDNLLNWGKQLVAGIAVQKKLFSPGKHIEHTLTLFEQQYAEKDIQIINEVKASDEMVMDEEHFSIILRNLVSNAIKFTPRSGTIAISMHHHDGKQIISVRDNGIGMSAGAIQKILKGSEPTTNMGTHLEKGTGLGLLLSKLLIEKNNGELQIESEEGIGSTFSIIIEARADIF